MIKNKEIVDFMKVLRKTDTDLMSWLNKTKKEFNLTTDELNEVYTLFQVSK